MRKLNIRKRPGPAEAPKPDALVMVAYASSWWSSKLVLPTIIGCLSILCALVLVSDQSLPALILGVFLAVLATTLGVQRHRQLRRNPVFEIWTNYLVHDGEVLTFAQLTDVGLSKEALRRRMWWWRKWELRLDWQIGGIHIINAEVADHDRAIDAVLRNLPSKFLTRLNAKRLRRAIQ